MKIVAPHSFSRFAVFLACLLLQSAYAQHVLYGEHEANSSQLQIYFDREGSAYPDYFIPDTALQYAGSSLKNWYQSHPDQFAEICARYGLPVLPDFTRQTAALQDKITAQLNERLLQLKDSFASVSFIIHGFRKSFKKHAPDFTSKEDFSDFEQAYLNQCKQKTLFVEVYWDGFYDCCVSSNVRKNKEIFKLFEQAQLHAIQAGNSMRKLLYDCPFTRINLIGHSLGAVVAVQSCFNYTEATEIPPAHKNIHLCLIAPAMAGTRSFESYYARNQKDTFTNDLYRLAIAYNHGDFVLRKRKRVAFIPLGPGPYKYGNTTLGCNHRNEALKLKKYFARHFPKSSIQLIDISDAGACHNLRKSCYCQDFIVRRIVGFCED